MINQLLRVYSEKGQTLSVPEYLELSSYDELVEIDLMNDRCRNLWHVDGKYFVPISDGTYRDLYQYCITHMIHPQDRGIYEELMNPDTIQQRLEAAEIPGVLCGQFRYRLQDGGWRWVEQCVIGGEENSLPAGLIRFYVFDVQNQKNREMGLQGGNHFEALRERDDTTGLLREKAFFACARELIRSRQEDWCLLALDIEHFILFNDWYGREAGQLLLAQIGGLLYEAEKKLGGLAGYLGQDDFCLLCPYESAQIRELYEQIHRRIAEQGSTVGFLPAIGVCMADSDSSVLNLYDQASLAAAQAKTDFRNRIRMFKPSMVEQTEKEYRILTDFQRALAERELFFCLQPQCNASSGGVVGAESLVRWRKSDGRIVLPGEFVPVLEKYGFITDMDKYIWEEVCKWLRSCMDRGIPLLPISVNISQIDLLTIDVAEYLEGLVRKYELPVEMLKAEITESAYANNTEIVKEAVKKLRSKGILVLMDDFGSGYSSLNMLSTLNVDMIKLDARFLHLSDEETKKGIHILESVISMAKSIALPMIVEGVETREQADFLFGLGCRYIQGYYFYRPMLVSEFEKILENDRKIDHRGFYFNPNEQFRIREFLDQNVYSDSMLNNILGAVAFYSLHDREVDIVRYNEQFRQAVNVPDFNDRLRNIERFVPEADLPELYELFERAVKDRLNGGVGMVRFAKWDGSVARFLIRAYYLGESGDGKRFYGIAQDVTELTELQDQMRLLSRYNSDSVVFIKRRPGGWRYRAVIHGLAPAVGFPREEFERELNTGRIFRRVDRETRRRIREISLGMGGNVGRYDFPVRLRTGSEQIVNLSAIVYQVQDPDSNTEFILIVRQA